MYALNLFLSFVLTNVLWNSIIKMILSILAIKSGLYKEGSIAICSSVSISISVFSLILMLMSVETILMNSFK